MLFFVCFCFHSVSTFLGVFFICLGKEKASNYVKTSVNQCFNTKTDNKSQNGKKFFPLDNLFDSDLVCEKAAEFGLLHESGSFINHT